MEEKNNSEEEIAAEEIEKAVSEDAQESIEEPEPEPEVPSEQEPETQPKQVEEKTGEKFNFTGEVIEKGDYYGIGEDGTNRKVAIYTNKLGKRHHQLFTGEVDNLDKEIII